MLAMSVGRFAFTPMLPIMLSEGVLSISESGVLASVHFLGYAMGALSARWPWALSKVTLTMSLLAIGMSTVVLGLADAYWIWLISRWIAGLCSALVLVIVGTQFIRMLAEVSRTDLQGWVFAGVGGGIAVVGLVALLLMLANSPSSQGWLFLGIATLIATVGIFALTRPMQFTNAQALHRERRDRSRRPWNLLIPYGAMGLGYIVPATYLPVMAQESVSSPILFGWSWPIFGAAAALSTVFVVRLCIRFSNRQVWVASQLVTAVGLFVPAISSHTMAVVFGGVCVGGTFMVITMVGLREALRIGGCSNAQFYVASMTAAFALGQLIGPLLAGWTYDATGSFSYPLILGSLTLAVSLIPILRQPSPAEHPA
ncbi:MAG: YbfB/YjiJ family MFS transporter [Hyphomicrobiaceae bacterium]